MIKIFEEYVEDFTKKIKSLEKIKDLSIKISNLYNDIFVDLDYIISLRNASTYFINFIDNSTESIFICELSLSESMVNRNNYSVNITLKWNRFVSIDNSEMCKPFYDFLTTIISPDGFNNVKIEDIDSLISKLDIEEYKLFTDVEKYNL